MAKGARRDAVKERFWRQMLEQFGRSQLSVRSFCQRYRLSQANFYAWRRTLRERDQAAQTAPFVRVDLPVAVPPAAPLEVVLPAGRVVRVAVGFDPLTLRQLLAALEAEPC